MRFYLFMILSFFGLACKSIKQTVGNDVKYNIILIVADDLGRNDLGCYGNKFIETPKIDQLAKEGVLCLNGYSAAPLCSPSRASLITGNNPARINLTEHLHGYSPPSPKQKLITPRIETGLASNLTTIPEALKSKGYATAHFGKWHLGGGASSPASQGFDFVYGGGTEGLPKTFFYPFFHGKPYPDLINDTKEGDYLDDALTTKAIQYLEQKKDHHFFMELNFYSPHVPIEGKPSLVKKYANKRQITNHQGLPEDEYAAMVDNIDGNIGRLIDELKKLELDKNTIVIFTSDNGALTVREVPDFAKHTPPTSAEPYSKGKGYIYEGGIRTPWVLWMPALIKKGRMETTVVSTDDIFNTCMDIAGIENKSPDGVSLFPLIRGEKISPRPFFMHFPHYSPQHGKPGAVVINNEHKLIEWYDTGKLELFNLMKDVGELNDIAKKHPALVKEMKISLDKWRLEVGAKMPTINPSYVE
jgi:arylsulfatase A